MMNELLLLKIKRDILESDYKKGNDSIKNIVDIISINRKINLYHVAK